MLSKVLLTPVDLLVDYVKDHDNCSVLELKKHLNVKQDLIEKWLTILEEYKVVKVNYKGLEAYVQFTEENREERDSLEDLEKLKELFIRKCKDKKLSYDKIKEVWPIFTKENEAELKLIFKKTAKTQGYDLTKVETAWIRFKQDFERL